MTDFEKEWHALVSRRSPSRVMRMALPLPLAEVVPGSQTEVAVRVHQLCRPLGLVLPVAHAHHIQVCAMKFGGPDTWLHVMLGEHDMDGALFAHGKEFLPIDFPTLQPSQIASARFATTAPTMVPLRATFIMMVPS